MIGEKIFFDEFWTEILMHACIKPWAGLFFLITTELGSTYFLLALIIGGFWFVDKESVLLIAILLGISVYSNFFLKIIFHYPRPPSEHWLKGAYATGYSLPSGHAQNSFVFYWWIGAKIRAWWVRISSLVLIVLIGLSRVYLGLHWLGDVFIGWAVGFVLLIVFWRLEEPLTKVVSQHNPNKFYVVLVLTNLSSTILTWLW